jgi:osmotically-inducible protein OsmY
MEAKKAKTADKELRNSVERMLDYEPQVTSTDIGVAADDGTVTLTGFVSTYAEKLAAEGAAKRTYGVKAVANDIQVKPAFKKTRIRKTFGHKLGTVRELLPFRQGL